MAKMTIAMGRSSEVPIFFNSAGARLMTTFSRGKMKPEFRMADLIRSLLSSMVRLAMPTMLSAGSPRQRSPSTVTRRPLNPYGIAELAFAVVIGLV